MTIIGRAQRDGVTIAVAPGGALRSVELEPEALQLGAERLAATIKDVVRQAARVANQAARQAMAEEVGELSDAELAVLGLDPLSDEDDATEAGRA
ncbi:hypothetical protein GCM10011581_22030 [Saccharopolyspora subtropica]|uniref:YbaB/EbfC DNA-binding family protein n=1 Tax=Saccharopolyspora thermophila TaxID=89367 RepID=A0A917JS93_9PSEU|nr:YbaB/EbfC family nucleoid-associated protein [Saccharopolyspora subtropica]GGI84486.1 hypothetical protein GCM10011581_22030 [Saccharopolyspora subtropica]